MHPCNVSGDEIAGFILLLTPPENDVDVDNDVDGLRNISGITDDSDDSPLFLSKMLSLSAIDSAFVGFSIASSSSNNVTHTSSCCIDKYSTDNRPGAALLLLLL